MFRIGPIVLVLALVLLLVKASFAWLERGGGTSPDLPPPETLLLYEVSAERAARFEVFPTDGVLRFLSHLELPATDRWDPERTWIYGLRVVLDEDGRETFSHTYWLETRQSKADPDGQRWRRECATTRDGRELGDDRLILVTLPEGRPADKAVLRVELVGEVGQRVLIRGYRPAERTATQTRITEMSLDEEGRETLAARLFRPSWQDLTQFERTRLLRNQWMRMTPLGIPGVDYEAVEILFTGFTLPEPVAVLERGRFLAPGHAMALNFAGSARIGIWARTAAWPQPAAVIERSGAPVEAPPPGTALVEGILLRPPGLSTSQSWSADVTGTAFSHLGIAEVEPGTVGTLSLYNRSTVPLRILVVLADGTTNEAVLGAPVLYPALEAPGLALQPYPRTYEALRIGPDLPAVTWTLFATADNGGDLARLVTYPSLGPDETGGVTYQVRLTLADETGRVIYQGSAAGLSFPSAFDENASADPADRSQVGEPQVSFLRFPPGTHRLTVTADRPVDAILEMPMCAYCEELPEPPYRGEVEPLRWRNQPLELARWIALRPDRVDDLEAEGRFTRVRAQVRLDVPEPIVPEPDLQYAVVEPALREKSSLMEQALDPSADRGAPWEYNEAVEIHPGRVYDVSVPASFRGLPVVLQYDLGSADALGKPLGLAWDDASRPPLPARTVVGRMTWMLPAGPHRVVLTGPDTGARYWLNVPVRGAGGSERFAQRTVYRMPAGRPVRFTLSHKAGTKQTLNVLLYRTGSTTPGVVTAIVDGGKPRLGPVGVASGITPAQKQGPIVAAIPTRSYLEAAPRAKVGAPQPFLVTLFEEADEGTHTVELTLDPSVRDVWVRAIVIGPKSLGDYRRWRMNPW